MAQGLTPQTHKNAHTPPNAVRYYKQDNYAVAPLTPLASTPDTLVYSGREAPWNGAASIARAVDYTSQSLAIDHAEPLAPLRQQDITALDELFDSSQIQDIALDIHRYLARLYPEPCWEDEPYEFLHGYI